MRMNFRAGRTVAGVLALTMLVTVTACGGDDDDDGANAANAANAAADDDASTTTVASDGETTYVGPLDGTTAQIALTRSGDEVFAFYCDSKELWGVLEGTADGSSIDATEPGGNTLSADVNGDSVKGTVVIDGDSHDFEATLATGDGGSYFQEVKDGDTVTYTGWVRADDGDVDGAQFKVDLSVLAKLPQFSAEERKTIQDIAATGVVPSAPSGTNVPADAQPLSFGSAIRCGIAGFKFKRAQSALSANETATTIGDFGNAIKGLESACGLDIPNW
jgi:hypothetical protein